MAREALNAFADVLDALVPEPLADRPSAIGGRPRLGGVSVHLRAVGANSFDPGAELLTATFPPAPAVSPPPVLAAGSEDEWLTKKAEWNRDVGAARTAIERRRTATSAATRKIRDLNLPPAGATDLWGCFSALSALLPADGSRRIILFSDLEQFGDQNKSGDLRGVQILIIHLVRRADAAILEQKSWASALGDLGATVTFSRPENQRADVQTFLTEGQH